MESLLRHVDMTIDYSQWLSFLEIREYETHEIVHTEDLTY